MHCGTSSSRPYFRGPWHRYREGNHQYAGKTDQDHPPRPNSDRRGDALLMGEGMDTIIRQYAGEVEIALGEARSAVSNPDAQRLGRIQRTWVWLLVLPPTVNGT